MQPINSSLAASAQAGTRTTAAPAVPADPAVLRPVVVRPNTADIPKPTESELKLAIKVANAALKEISSDLEFAHDDTTGKTLVRVFDTNTKEMIRQFPTEEMLAIAKAIDGFQGLLIQQKA